jgi:hypothetical protein
VLGERTPEDLTEVPGLADRQMLDQAEEVRPGGGQRAADGILREPFELPDQHFAHLTQAAMQACFGVCVPGLLMRPRAGQDIPALLALIDHGQEHASRLASCETTTAVTRT